MRTLRWVGIVASLGAATLAACSGDTAGNDDPVSRKKDAGPGDGEVNGDVQISRPDEDAAVNADGPSSCAATSSKASVSDIDMYVMLDRSTSMTTQNRWAAVVNAVTNVVYDKRFWGMGMGVQYFPLQALCRVSAYAAPDVAIGTLPAPAPAIASSLGNNEPFGESPMVPALLGAVEYATQWQKDHPQRTTVIVLASDGLPDNTCQTVADGGVVNDLAGMIKIAQDAANGSPPVRTFVIGVGDELTGLNQIAAAGGTQAAVFVDTQAGVEAQFMDALNNVRKKAISCDYVIPPPTTGKIDYGKVNVQFTPNNGQAAESLVYVKSVQNCALAPNGGGWYYDDEANATRVLLCPEACTRAKASDKGQLDVAFGCATQAAPTIPPPK